MRAEQTFSVDSPAITRVAPTCFARRFPLAPPLVWLNLFCLDAPIVAVAWQWLFAHEFHFLVSISERVALFFTAWIIYLADRLADAVSVRSVSESSLREKFCRRHLRWWTAVLAIAAAIDAFVVLRYLSANALGMGFAIGSFSVFYLGLNYWCGGLWRFLPVKELCVGFLFAFGTVAILLTQAGASSANFTAAFFLFGILCFFNCVSIAVWEHDLDLAQKKNSIATRWPFLGGYLRWFAFLLVVLASLGFLAAKSPAELTACVVASALFLGGLDYFREEISRDARTALADLVLLTPLVALIFAW